MLLSSANYYAPKVPHSSIKYSIWIEKIKKKKSSWWLQKVNKELDGVAKRRGRIREYTKLSPKDANIMRYRRLKIAISIGIQSLQTKSVLTYWSLRERPNAVPRCQFQIFKQSSMSISNFQLGRKVRRYYRVILMSLLVSKTIRGSRYRLKYLMLDLKKSTKIRVRGQIHVKNVENPNLLYGGECFTGN